MNKKYSNDFIVFFEIQKAQNENRKIWFTDLAERLKDTMGKQEVLRGIGSLEQWGLICGQYGDLGNGWAGRLLYIDEVADGIFDKQMADYYKLKEGGKPRLFVI